MINLTLAISKAAAQEVKRIQSSRQKLDSYLLLTVERGGCSGLFYNLTLIDTIQPGHRTFHSNGIPIVVASASYSYLNGLKIDYSEDLMGGGFRFHNPNSVSSCSCGQSFSVENS